jgi:hypothetical protein
VKTPVSKQAIGAPNAGPEMPRGAFGGVESRPVDQTALQTRCTVVQRALQTPVLIGDPAPNPDAGTILHRQWVIYCGGDDHGIREIVCAPSRDEAIQRIRHEYPVGTPMMAYELMPMRVPVRPQRSA